MKSHALLVVGLVACFGLARADKPPVVQTLCDLMRGARQTLLFLPELTDLKLSDCIRNTVVNHIKPTALQRTRFFYVLTVPYFLRDEQSTLPSLVLAGVPVFSANVNDRRGLAIIDGAAFVGEGLGKPDPRLQWLPANKTNVLIAQFSKRLKNAVVLSPRDVLAWLQERK